MAVRKKKWQRKCKCGNIATYTNKYHMLSAQQNDQKCNKCKNEWSRKNRTPEQLTLLSSERNTAQYEKNIRNGMCVKHPTQKALPGRITCKLCNADSLINGPWKNIKRLYGWTKEEYLEAYNNRHGCCDICKTHCEPIGNGADRKHVIHIDHDHATGAVRGMLCQRCNNFLARVNEDVELIRRIRKNTKKYLLRQHKEEHRGT